MNRKVFIFNPVNNKPLEVDFSKTPYWNDILQIIKNNGCTDSQYNLISCYLIKRSGKVHYRKKIIIGQIERKTILDSLIENKISKKRMISNNIIKSCIAVYLYKEYSVLFFQSKTKLFSFFKTTTFGKL